MKCCIASKKKKNKRKRNQTGHAPNCVFRTSNIRDEVDTRVSDEFEVILEIVTRPHVFKYTI